MYFQDVLGVPEVIINSRFSKDNSLSSASTCIAPTF